MRQKKSSILLVQSYLGGEETPVFPLGLAILAGTLSDYNVELLDLNVKDEPFQALEETLNRFKPDVVGISIRNIDSTNKRKVSFYYSHMQPTLRHLLNNGRDPVIVLGGSGFSMYAERIMEDIKEATFGVYLEGEETFPRLLENLDHPEKVKGLFYRNKGRIIFTGERKPPDFTQIPRPRWELLDMKKYSRFSTGIGIETKRGCSLNCAYCPYPFLNGKQYRLKPPPLVLDEIEELVKKYDIREITFTDSIFNIPLSHAEELCQGLIDRKLNVRWIAWFNEKNITKEFLLLAKEAGCSNFIFSPDGFSDSILKRIQKNIRMEDILRTFNIIRKVDNVRVSYNLFKNPPGQTLITALAMLIFLIKAKLSLGERVSFELNSLRIEPHTYLCKIAEEEGLLKKEHDLLYPKYYSNINTLYIEKLFNLLLRLKGK